MGDFNAWLEEIGVSRFCVTFGLKDLVKDATCYNSPENPSSIDLILTNKPHSFQNSSGIETDISDFLRMVVTVMKTSFEWLKPRVINYRDYKSFEKKLFRGELLFELSNSTLEENADGLEKFIAICQKTLDYLPCPSQTKVCTGQPFAIYEQNPFKSNNA